MLLHFHKLGYGPHILLAFHGIGQDGVSCFKPFEEKLGNYYTIYAFDLFFHGKNKLTDSESDFAEPNLITKDVWNNMLSDFLTKERISRFDITGFSIGGRFALATLEAFSNLIDHAFLIAPDGISRHPLYAFATGFAPARKLFRACMQRPGTFFRVTALLQNAGLVPKSLYKFTQNVLNTPEKRHTIYSSWVAFRPLHFDIAGLYQQANTNNVNLHLFIGKYDKLLPERAVKNLSKLIPPTHYHILHSGHGILVEKVAFLLAEKFLI